MEGVGSRGSKKEKTFNNYTMPHPILVCFRMAPIDDIKCSEIEEIQEENGPESAQIEEIRLSVHHPLERVQR